MFTDWNACLMDTLNALVGRRILDRESCGVPHLAIPIMKARPLLQQHNFELCRVHAENHGVVPKMEQLMQARGKLFIVEYVYPVSTKDAHDYHVIGVDTDVRAVFCNTLGVLPFSLKAKTRETQATRRGVIGMLKVLHVLKVHCLTKKKPSMKKRTHDSLDSRETEKVEN